MRTHAAFFTGRQGRVFGTERFFLPVILALDNKKAKPGLFA